MNNSIFIDFEKIKRIPKIRSNNIVLSDSPKARIYSQHFDLSQNNYLDIKRLHKESPLRVC